MMKIRFLLLLVVALLPSCISTQLTPEDPVAARIVVDVSEGKLVAEDSDGEVVLECDVETSRKGTGTRIHSKRTPLGDYTIAKLEPDHRFGAAMRLNGYQGFNRGILFHPNLDGLPDGTNGCICPLEDEDMWKLYAVTRVGTGVLIKQ